MINSFRENYYFLSNFYEAPVEWEGIKYLNNEAAFQSAKVFGNDFILDGRYLYIFPVEI